VNVSDAKTDGTVTSQQLAVLVDRFYAKVRADEFIGVVFNAAVADWPEHLEKLARFWSSVMLSTGAYKGDPMAAHTKHAAAIKPEMFDRWLALWADTTAEVCDAATASALQAKAHNIARSLKMGLEFHAKMSAHDMSGKRTPA
jgi:hemoglobin